MRKFLSLINLIKTQIFCIYDLKKIFIVYKNIKLIFKVLQIVLLYLEYFDNGPKLTVISFYLVLIKIIFLEK